MLQLNVDSPFSCRWEHFYIDCICFSFLHKSWTAMHHDSHQACRERNPKKKIQINILCPSVRRYPNRSINFSIVMSPLEELETVKQQKHLLDKVLGCLRVDRFWRVHLPCRCNDFAAAQLRHRTANTGEF